ncbi:hypothetical protein ACLOJK_036508, partial [Asimina triloba]
MDATKGERRRKKWLPWLPIYISSPSPDLRNRSRLIGGRDMRRFLFKPNKKILTTPLFRSARLVISPSPIIRHVVDRCASIRHDNPFAQTLSFFDWATSLPHFPPSPPLYVAMIDLCRK